MAEILMVVSAKEAEDKRKYVELGSGLRLVIKDGRIEGWYFCEKDPFEELLKAEHRAEAFERMAFELKEERDRLLKIAVRLEEICDNCAYGEFHEECDEADCDCSACKSEGCICKGCMDGDCFRPKREE